MNLLTSKITSSLVLLASVSISNHSLAGTPCTGKIENVFIDTRGGALLVSMEGAFKYSKLCLLGDNFKSVTAESCRSLYSALSVARQLKKPITLHFDFDGLSCTSTGNFPPWQPPFANFYAFDF